MSRRSLHIRAEESIENIKTRSRISSALSQLAVAVETFKLDNDPLIKRVNNSNR